MPTSKDLLYDYGVVRVTRFCMANKIPIPTIRPVSLSSWVVDACAFYRPDEERYRKWSHAGISICIEKCASAATQEQNRNWNWPAGITDRTPYGVLCHELGHHCDYLAGEKKWSYGSEYSTDVMEKSGERSITSYDPNPAEWFAEMFRLFVTNHMLLHLIRPKTWDILVQRWKPVSRDDYLKQLGKVPPRILKSIHNKMKV